MPASTFLPSKPHHPSPKLNLTTSTLSPYISPKQPPTKKSPFQQINSVPYIRTATLILPSELYDLIVPHIPTPLLSPIYVKFIAPLRTLLTGNFFNNCIKRPGSNLLLLSEGVPGVDDKYTLHNGKLSLDLGKDVYRRSGLQGVVSNDGGRKHVSGRWRVEYDLRKDSSVQGKKGFEKVRRACEPDGCLGRGVSWLGFDVEKLGKGVGDDQGIQELHARLCEARGETKTIGGVLVPDLLSGKEMENMDEEEWWEVVEWIDLVALGSPRVEDGDMVDSYVSRYSVPGPASREDLRAMKWEGLISSEWITRLLIEIIKQSRIRKSKHWVALSVTGYRTEAVGGVDGYTIVLQADECQGDTEQPVEHQDEVEMDTDETKGQTGKGPGLRKAVCFQFVDAVSS